MYIELPDYDDLPGCDLPAVVELAAISGGISDGFP